jgi:CheY-like chemotaxis protein
MTYTIIVLEDDAAQRYAVSEHLEALGYTVVPVASGMAALEAAENRTVHLLVTDLVLPGGPHGLSVANMLRHRHRIPTIFITGYADLAGRFSGEGTVFAKPVDLAELAAEVARIVPASPNPLAPPVASETSVRIRRWRMKAEELRTAADSFADPSSRQHMRLTAQTYDTLADRAEARLHQQRDAKPDVG